MEYAFPATVGQEAFWFLDRLRPGNPAYNIAVRFRLTGPLRPAVLEQALAEVVRRHEALRTTFATEDGDLLQRVATAGLVHLPIDDLGDPDPARAEELMAREASRGFDLEAGPLFRARLLRLRAQEHVLLLTMHHIIADGWSTGLIISELAALYASFAAGRPSPLPDLPLQYGDFAVWQADYLATPVVAAQLDYWKRQLAGLEPLFVPHDRQPAPGTPPRGRIESILLPRELTDRLTRLSRQHGVTLFPTCLACLKLLLHFRSSRDDVAVGTLVAGRSRTELEPLVGLFVNNLVLRTDLSGDPTFLELLARVRGMVAEAMDNQDVPFGRVVEAVAVRRQKGRQPLYGVNFLFQTAFLKPLEAGDVTITPVPSLSPGAMLDLNLFMVERGEGWRVSCEYNPDEYELDTIRRLLSDFRGLLERIAADPHRRASDLRPLPVATPRADAGVAVQRNGHHATIPRPADARLTAPAAIEPGSGPTDPEGGRDDLVARLGAVWRDVLRVGEIGPTEDFFDLGGHSLTAARLVAKIQSRFGLRLSPTTVFEYPTFRQFATFVRDAVARDQAAGAGDRPKHPSETRKVKHDSPNGVIANYTPAPAAGAERVADGSRATPFFFQSPGGQLYGVYAPPTGKDRHEAVVLCAPTGHEYITTHWCLRLLATDLSRVGFHVLRFDYSCMGHSWGEFEDASVARWEEDVGAAIRELAGRSGVAAVSLVGLRLGASLAYRATRRTPVRHLVLWDPVSGGREYVGQLRRMQRQGAQGDTPGAPVEELLGYFYPAGLVGELEQIDLAAVAPRCDRTSLLLSEDSPGTTRLLERLAGRGPRPAIESVTNHERWGDANAHHLQLLLPQARRAVVNLLVRERHD